MPGLFPFATNAPIVALALLALLGLIVLAILYMFGKADGIRLFRWRWLGLTLERDKPSTAELEPGAEEPGDRDSA